MASSTIVMEQANSTFSLAARNRASLLLVTFGRLAFMLSGCA